MSFCRFCGKELINGQCDCPKFQASMENESANQYQEQKDPFLVSGFQTDFSSFSAFVSSMRDQTGMSEPTSNVSDPFEHNVPIVPDCIQKEDNEIVVKQYNIAKLRTRLKFMKAEGRLMVTNRRILFRAAGTSLTGNILQEHQFNIDEISGIQIHKDYKFSILSFIGCFLLNFFALSLTSVLFITASSEGAVAIGVILGVLGILPSVMVYKRFWMKLLCAIVASGCFSMANAVAAGDSLFLGFLVIVANIFVFINLIIVCYVPNLVIKIKTKSGSGAIEIGGQKAMFIRQTGDEYSGFAEVMPWEDTVMAINELGTMIDDLQKLGDFAIEKWSR